MGFIKVDKEAQTVIDADGITTTTIKENTTNISRNEEPDYIKIYTRMWCEFNQIPKSEQDFFLELACRMTYANTGDKDGGQVVATGGMIEKALCDKFKIKHDMYQKHLKSLCQCGAIRRVARGWYQINPQYAGKGEWKYNPKLDRGGVEDLVAKFNFKDGTVDTNIIWADDGTDSDFNQMYRNGLQVSPKDNTVLKSVDKQLDGQLEINDVNMNLKEVVNE